MNGIRLRVFAMGVLGILVLPTGSLAVIVSVGSGASFSQISFTWSSGLEPDSNWAQFDVDIAALTAATGIQQGFINVSTGLGWVVQNVPVNAASSYPTTGSHFGLFAGGFQSSLPAYIDFSPNPVSSFIGGTLNPFTLGHVEYDAGGFGLDPITGPPPPPGANVATFSTGASNSLFLQPGHPNVEAAKNQCAPIAVANSLQYLENRFGVSVPHPHVPGWLKENPGGAVPTSLVGQMDLFMDRIVTSTTVGQGVSATNMLTGMLQYLDTYNLDYLLVRHQGRGFGDLPSGNITEGSATSIDDGAKVTADWILGQLEMGEDVKIAYKWSTVVEGVVKTGAHMVQLVAGGRINGTDPWVTYAHDRRQGDNNRGLETRAVHLRDYDNDGILNFGHEDREFIFAVSTSVPEPSSATLATLAIGTLALVGYRRLRKLKWTPKAGQPDKV